MTFFNNMVVIGGDPGIFSRLSLLILNHWRIEDLAVGGT